MKEKVDMKKKEIRQERKRRIKQGSRQEDEEADNNMSVNLYMCPTPKEIHGTRNGGTLFRSYFFKHFGAQTHIVDQAFVGVLNKTMVAPIFTAAFRNS